MVRHHTQRGVPNGKKFDRTTRLPIESKQLDSALVPAPQPARPECVEMTLVESLKSLQFWMIYFMFIGAVLAGLLILSKIQTIIQNQLGGSPQEAVKMNAVLGGLNLLGRLLLPLSSDLLKTHKLIYGISLAVQAVCVGFLPTALHAGNYSGTLACIFIICFFYGGSLGMMPAFLADQFGASIVGATYGVMLTAWALAGVGGGFIFSAVYNQQHAKYPSLDMAYMWYEVNFRWILGPIVLGFFITLFIPTNVRDVKLPRVPGELFRLRLINDRLFRFTKWRGHILTREEEETEWQAYLENSKIAEKESETHPNGVAAPAKSGDLPGSCELNSVV
ncbi:hypothetical protein BV898_12167 [Hypsibius exemplaris]|uniref:Oxalate:formate antiporter n=1 Tax=Hypsibius exemplaris TaxID=2072580 RepID=A0A1W0WEI3_HYPEX|nr:hypothetical protein BV898_12167 [Hypsibius exemplaris]